jgi:hypothetical protein
MVLKGNIDRVHKSKIYVHVSKIEIKNLKKPYYITRQETGTEAV